MSDKTTCGLLTGTECDSAYVLVTEDVGSYWCAHPPLSPIVKATALLLIDGHPDFHSYCWNCGARLSFDAGGNPVAEVMVPLDTALDADRRATVVLARWMDNWLAEEIAHEMDGGLKEDFREAMLDLFGVGADELDADEAPALAAEEVPDGSKG